MRMKYVALIQSGLTQYRTISTKAASSRLLDGSYNSIFKGKSMNFDSLREYVVGDDLKDVDWKATARSSKMLVREYIAERRHNIMLVMDSNMRMLGHANDTDEKERIAIMAAGTLAYLVDDNGDYVSATYGIPTYGGGSSIAHHPFKTGKMNLEKILLGYDRATTLENHTDLNDTLVYITKNFNRRMILVLVTDAEGISRLDEVLLKRLLVRHDILIMNVSDADTEGKDIYSLDESRYLPDFITKDKKLAQQAAEYRLKREQENEYKLARLGIAVSTFDKCVEIEKDLVALLEKHKGEMR